MALSSLSLLDYLLLGLIDQAPQSGYDLRKSFKLTPLRHFSDSPGTIYPCLRRLQRRGWIAPLLGSETSRRRREPFRLTPRGRRAWISWLREPVTRSEVIWGMDVLLPRFAFMSQALAPQEAVRFLESFRTAVGSYLAELRQFHRREGGGLALTGRLAFESGLDSYAAQLRWARRALAELRRKGRKR